jgi:metal-dependent amidase/aminoacylase/carboxypeptidase family protein
MNGTIRTLNSQVQDMIHKSKEVVTAIAECWAKAEIAITKQTLVTYNDPNLTEKCFQL